MNDFESGMVSEAGQIAAFGGYISLALIYTLWGRWGWRGYGFLLAALAIAAPGRSGPGCALGTRPAMQTALGRATWRSRR
jgi:hypothetical protein